MNVEVSVLVAGGMSPLMREHPKAMGDLKCGVARRAPTPLGPSRGGSNPRPSADIHQTAALVLSIPKVPALRAAEVPRALLARARPVPGSARGSIFKDRL